MKSSFGNIIEEEEDMERRSPEQYYNSAKAVNEENCPSTATTQTACEAVPNAVWISTGDNTGVCHCCLTNGEIYADATSTTEPCKSCTVGTTPLQCGIPNAFCGSYTIPNCVQNSDALTWSINCGEKDAICNGYCSGTCGVVGEWLEFQSCTQVASTISPPVYSCQFNLFQWKSWIFYIVISVLLTLLFIFLYYAFRSNVPNRAIIQYIPVQNIA